MSRSSIVYLVALAGFSLACGILDDEDTNISYEEEIPYSFTVDADQLCASECDQSPVDAQQDRQLATLETGGDIDIVEATGNDTLRDFSGVFRSIEITQIDYAVDDNDLTFDLPPTTVYIGPKGADDKDDPGVVQLATIPEIPAGQDAHGTAEVSEAGRSESADIFQNLKLSTVIFAQPTVKEGQPLPPSGSTQESLSIHVTFTANPQDAIN